MDKPEPRDKEIEKQKKRLDTYRFFTSDSDSALRLLSASDASSFPPNCIEKDMGGDGPNSCCLIRYDGNRIIVENQKTDIIEGISPVMFHGNVAIRIRKKRSSKDVKKHSDSKPLDVYKVEDLAFPVYHSIITILGEMVLYKKFPLEWSCCWLVVNMNYLPVVDGFTSVKTKKKPLRLKRVISMLIALESTGLAIYTKKGYPNYLQVETGVHITITDDGEVKAVSGDIDSTKKDLIPIPNCYIRKTSEIDSEGIQKYEVYKGENNCSLALMKIHGRLKVDKNIEKQILTLSDLITKCYTFSPKNSIIYNIPYVSLNEVIEADKMLFH